MFGVPRHGPTKNNNLDSAVRGGGDSPSHTTSSSSRSSIAKHNDGTAWIEEYVAAVEERDARDREDEEHSEEKDDCDSSSNGGGAPSTEQDESSADKQDNGKASSAADKEEAVAVGVKSHKKSGSVGDADSDDDDDNDDDSDTDESDWEELEENVDNLMVTPAQMEVEVEFVEDEQQHSPETEDHDESPKSVGTGGGVGVIANQKRASRRNTRARSVATATFAQSPVKEQEMLEAWLPHVYLPPSKKAMEYLSENARMIDGASKTRLDRRTLYACLLLEWWNANATYRKFLEKFTSQALQAALSLATQPQWRKCSAQRLCGIRLYDNDAERGCTLAMQETIVMALVSRLNPE